MDSEESEVEEKLEEEEEDEEEQHEEGGDLDKKMFDKVRAIIFLQYLAIHQLYYQFIVPVQCTMGI